MSIGHELKTDECRHEDQLSLYRWMCKLCDEIAVPHSCILSGIFDGWQKMEWLLAKDVLPIASIGEFWLEEVTDADILIRW